MSQLQSATFKASPEIPATPEFFETRAYRNAIDKLSLAYCNRVPIVALLAEGVDAPRFVGRRFIEALTDEPVVVRIAEPCTDVADLLQRLVRGAGFDPGNLGSADLQSVFKLFLVFQKNHDRRTVLFLERGEANNRWILDKLAELVCMEERKSLGLMTVLSGSPRLGQLLNENALGDNLDRPVMRIPIAPFNLDDTREYVRRRVDAAGRTSLDRLFDYQAIPVLHEITGGVPDAVSRVTSRSIEVAEATGLDLITPEQITRAHSSLPAGRTGLDADPDAETIHLNAARPHAGRLVVTIDNDTIGDLPVGQGHVLIGRSRLCDVRILSATVSRQHALIVFESDGNVTLVDLSSTNGTFVDGYSITEHSLIPGETIAIGEGRIDYCADTAPRSIPTGPRT